MGNHEYCPECGENDYHHGSPCNPVKVAKVKQEKEEVAALWRVGKELTLKQLETLGIPSNRLEINTCYVKVWYR